MAESKKIYRISSLNLSEINLILSQLGDRLDQMEGYRGNPVLRSDTTLTQSDLLYEDDSGMVIHSIGGYPE